jgi:hypothetical protein
MPRSFILTGAAAVVAIGIGLFVIAGPRAPDGLGRVGGAPTPLTPSDGPTPTPTLPPVASPSAGLDLVGDTSSWQPFASSRYGYSAAHPAGWTETPATRTWSWSRDVTDWQTPAADSFRDDRPGAGYHHVLVTAFAVDVANGTTLADWSRLYLSPSGLNPGLGGSASCAITSDASVLIDGHTGRIVNSSCGESDAFVLLGRRMFVFSDWLSGDRALLDAFLTTVRFGSR